MSKYKTHQNENMSKCKHIKIQTISNCKTSIKRKSKCQTYQNINVSKCKCIKIQPIPNYKVYQNMKRKKYKNISKCKTFHNQILTTFLQLKKLN